MTKASSLIFFAFFMRMVTGSCPPGWEYWVSGSRCYHLLQIESNWYNANHVCSSLGGYLATTRTAGEFSFARAYIERIQGNSRPVWIGASDKDRTGVFIWEYRYPHTMDMDTFNGWAPGEPTPREHCVLMDPRYNYHYYWNNEGCGDNNHVLCEMSS